MAPRVLIVDDDFQFRQTAAELLRRHGFEPAGSASDAREALRMLGEQTFDAALVDVHLPDGDGLELTKRTKRDQPDLRVVLTSSDPDAVTRDAARDAGAAAFVTKTDLLAAKLRDLFRAG